MKGVRILLILIKFWFYRRELNKEKEAVPFNIKINLNFVWYCTSSRSIHVALTIGCFNDQSVFTM